MEKHYLFRIKIQIVHNLNNPPPPPSYWGNTHTKGQKCKDICFKTDPSLANQKI